MLSAIDEGVKQVVEALKKNGNMYDNTYIVFTSDNGGSNSAGSSTYPLRGQKGSYYEGGVFVCGMIYSNLYVTSIYVISIYLCIYIYDDDAVYLYNA